MTVQYRGESDAAFAKRLAADKRRWKNKLGRMIADWGGLKGAVTFRVEQSPDSITFTVTRSKKG